jgi:hypothetical protein
MKETAPPAPPSQRPFTQGVATVFQFVGVGLFLISMFICCSSSLLSKDSATHTSLTTIGWHVGGDPADRPSYSAQRAITVILPSTICYGMALAAVGLGLQAESRNAPAMGIVLNLLGIIFWLTHLAFFASIGWIVMSILCTLLGMLTVLMLVLAIGAARDMRRAIGEGVKGDHS